jgi:uncharacterized protein (DUF2126 family)/transglutaminase-like putative cysteine protease
MRVKIENCVRYSYEKPVSFSPHRIRLYPRTDQAIVTHRLETLVNVAADVQYRRDLFDNLVASCFFPQPADTLEIRSRLEVELWPKNPFHFLLAPRATEIPFAYAAEEAKVLEPFLTVKPEEDFDPDDLWRFGNKRDTIEALVELAQILHNEIAYEVREDGDARLPSKTLELRSGACRDTALLCATIMRKHGLAVRLVSGFLCDFQVDVPERRPDSALHAWIEVFLPGAGWVGIDPTNGTFCDHRFIPTAVGVSLTDVAPIEGSYFGQEKIPGTFESRLQLSLVTEEDLRPVASHVEQVLQTKSVLLTMGGEPTYVPEDPEGPEWNFAAVGPSKLLYAYAFARAVEKEVWPGSLLLYTPGKLYPGEVNPRWALHVLRPEKPFQLSDENRDDKPDERLAKQFRDGVIQKLGLEDRWMKAIDLKEPKKPVWVLPLDYQEDRWRTDKWNLRKFELTAADGPSGLRLPIQDLPPEALRRAMVIDLASDHVDLFLPPLLAVPFEQLIRICSALLQTVSVNWQGYSPIDAPSAWSHLVFSADPGVLEVNLPACSSWQEYRGWVEQLSRIASSIGLRAHKESSTIFGTGGGNHVLFGGITLERNPLFSRPGWLASILRYWQRHPSLSYLFTGAYVGPSAQAPRPDESGQRLLDLELAYRQLEKLSPGDQRGAISEIVRHLHTDSSGNPHRSEISFDKFWSPPIGFMGLIEFRAIESLPKSEWIAAVALLFRALLAYLLERPYQTSLKDWGDHLHDRYFLPTPLWTDLTDVLTDLAQFGFAFDPAIFRQIWEWRFAPLLNFAGLTVRHALESWPLLSDTPLDGSTTSRFVDTSIARLEFALTTDAYRNFTVYINGRQLPFRSLSARELVAGLRYRATALYPSLHPKIPVQLPLELTLVNRETDQPLRRFSLSAGQSAFSEQTEGEFVRKAPLEPGVPELMTCDLRIEESLFREN